MGHTLQFPLALSIAISKPDQTKVNLIISRHVNWNYINIDEFRKYFKSLWVFPHIEYAHGIFQAIQTVRKLRQTREQIRKLPIAQGDVIISIEAWNYVENLVTTVFAKNKQIFLCPDGIYDFVSLGLEKIKNTKQYHLTKSGYIHYYLIEKLLRLKKRTLFYWFRDERTDHGITYSRDVEEFYNKVFILKSLFVENLKENELHYPYPVLQKLSSDISSKKRIVFFLTSYVKNNDYYKKITQILQNLRNQFEEKYLLEIRPHPYYPHEPDKVNYEGWAINREPGTSEIYFMNHANQIHAAISHVSTALVFALNLGIPSYSYHRAMGFEKDYTAWHDKLYEGAPEKFFLNTLEAVPKPYEPAPYAQIKAKHSLDKLLQEIYK